VKKTLSILRSTWLAGRASAAQEICGKSGEQRGAFERGGDGAALIAKLEIKADHGDGTTVRDGVK